MDSPHNRIGVVLETAMIALMHDGSLVVLGFVPPIPPLRPHAGQPYLAWKQANSSVLHREPAVSAHMDGCPISYGMEASELALAWYTSREGESLSL